MKAILTAVTLAVSGLLAGVIGMVAVRGAGALSPEFLLELPARAGREGGILPVLVSTGLLVAGALGVAVPLGLGAAVYLQEYTAPGGLAGVLRPLTETLAGVPSVIFGLFGFSLFVVRLGWGWSLAAGSLTLALMLLPTVIRTAEEALAAVPPELREAAAALGASPEQRLARVVLRVAAPGILTGVILGVGRAIGETAAVMLTAGSSLGMPGSPLDPGRPLAVHLYILASEGLSDSRAYGTAVLLMALVLAVNLTAAFAMERLRRGGDSR